ncbi:sugar ABC transporter permease [Pseudonocardia eucalypti]|uniref:Sugar ABC transporter permease n=1 Tax=Pseudonocardia eucalypti TaxID=648755 RepID=A0ABP9PY77_9PSEU|nr:ABC-type sugar transport system permease subunit [Pseudonocardia eucalypti]
MNRHRIAPYLFVLPNMVLFALFTIWPAINGFNISRYDSSNGRTFRPVGAGNYAELAESAEFWRVAGQTAVFVVSLVLLTTVASTALALLLHAQRRAAGAFRAAYFVPFVVSPVVAGLIWSLALERQNGLVNAVLSELGLGRPGWLLDGRLAMVVIIGVGLWAQLGFYALIQLAGLQGIDAGLYEAARIDGASGWQQVRSITLPLLRPTTLVVVVLATIHGFQAFDYIYTLTGGGPLGATTLIVQYIYDSSFQSPIRYGLASAAGVVLFVTVLGVTLANYLLGRRREVM